jgi:hypothetical protein
MSAAIVAGAVAAAVVVILVVAVVASALTSGSPAPQPGLGNTGPAAAGTSDGGQPSSAPASFNPTITGSTFVDQLPSTVLESHVIDVNLVKVVDPAQETSGDAVAGNGYRFVAVIFQIKCISGHEYAEPKVQISTSDGQSYSPEIVSIAGYSGLGYYSNFTISAGQSDTFVIPYLLPDGVTITGVEWEPYFSEGSDGEWTVRE